MNVLFFLTPKGDVQCVDADSTLRQALEKLEKSGFTALPIISKRGKYVGTITEGDLLWYIKNNTHLTLFDAEDVPIKKVPRRRDNMPVPANADMHSLLDKVLAQNFVPVVDDDNVFIGIVTRRDIMKFFEKKLEEN